MEHQAFAQLLGNYGEFVGALAVVATLIYFSLQIRGMREGAYLQAIASTQNQETELNKLGAAHADTIVKANAGQELSDTERYKLMNVYRAHAGYAFHYHLLEMQSDSPRHIRAMTFAKILRENPAFLEMFHAEHWPTPEAANWKEIVNQHLRSDGDDDAEV